MADRERQLRKEAYKIILWQGVLTLFASLLTTFFVGTHEGFSLFLGCVVALISNFSFAKTLFSLRRPEIPKKFMGALFRAEVYKILITVLLTLSAIQWAKVAFLPFVLGYTLCSFVFWFSPLILQKKKAVSL